MTAETVGHVDGLVPGGPAARGGVQPGDELLAVNGLVPRDIVDVRLDGGGPRVELDLRRNGKNVILTIEKRPDEDLGILFEHPAFDRLKTCNNACEFCFIAGLPRGLRHTLYIKDDDFRYSFLYGSFTTLTNLSEMEWRRILFQRLSPLRVSVHATDPSLRSELLRNPQAPPILAQLDELGEHGIRVHAQIVLMPGRNDGIALRSTIADLAARYPTVESVAVVPVGLTAHARVTKTRPVQPADAAAAIDLVEEWQRSCRRAFACGFVYASDELYLLAGRRLPSARSYDGFPQLQNGVGCVQLFRADWKRAARRLPEAVDPPMAVAWATGRLMAPILQACAADLASVRGLSVEVVSVENSLFGAQVTVAGLVTARDLLDAVSDRGIDRLILPRSMLDAQGQRTIDDWSLQDIAERLRVEAVVGANARDLVEASVRREPESLPVARPVDTIARHQCKSTREGEQACAAS
ncbi:MAG: DUF512 domain-containing protein [Chloroflexi bacterium]|nr:DUF512 domain-containing protein [Chloroflexota bacterium]